MRYIFFAIFCSIFLIANSANAQQVQDAYEKNPVTIDQKGNILEDEEVFRRMQTGKWKADPKFDSEGKLLYLQLIKATAEEQEMMKEISSGSKKNINGQKAPHFFAEDYNGNAVNFTARSGKVTVLNFWHLDCPPCLKFHADLNDLLVEYKDDHRVNFISITYEYKEVVAEALKVYPINISLITEARDIGNQYSIDVYPATLVIDKNGQVFSTQYGGSSNKKRDLAQNINSALAGKAPLQHRKTPELKLSKENLYYLNDGKKINFEKANKLLASGYYPKYQIDKYGKEYYLILRP